MTITMTRPCSYVVLKASLRLFVPCTIDQYVDISKVSEDFKVVEMAVASERVVGLRPEGGSGGAVRCVP